MLDKNYLDDDVEVVSNNVNNTKNDEEDIHPSGAELGKGLLLSAAYLTLLPVAILLIIMMFVELPNPYIWGQEGPYNVASTIAQLIAGALVVVGMYFASKPLFKKTLKNFKNGTFGKAIKYALLAYAVVLGCGIVDQIIFGPSKVNANQQNVTDLLVTSPLVGCLLTIVIAPLVEELIFRYYIFKGIEKRRPALAFVVTALAFGGLHLIASIGTPFFLEDLRSLPSYVAAGLVFCYGYYKTKNFGVNVLAHMLYNGLATILLFSVSSDAYYVKVENVVQSTNSIEIAIEENSIYNVQVSSLDIYVYDTYNPYGNEAPLQTIVGDYGKFTNLTPDTQYLIMINYSYSDVEMGMVGVEASEYIDLYTLGEY